MRTGLIKQARKIGMRTISCLVIVTRDSFRGGSSGRRTRRRQDQHAIF